MTLHQQSQLSLVSPLAVTSVTALGMDWRNELPCLPWNGVSRASVVVRERSLCELGFRFIINTDLRCRSA